MKSLKRRIANVIEYLSGNLVVPPNEVYRMSEWFHLQRFFQHFGIDCVFDVGANHGQYAQMLRKKVGFAGDIISFEPIPELVKELKENSTSDLHWHIEGVALDREAGLATFHVMKHSDFSSLLAPRADQPAAFKEMNKIVRSIEVRRSTVAVEVRKYQQKLGFKCPFLKMDTQGADCAVVEGAGDAITQFVGIQTELAICQLYEGGTGLTQALTQLAACGFEPSAFIPIAEAHFPMLVEVDCILVRRDAVDRQ